jgi:hypothetical protein
MAGTGKLPFLERRGIQATSGFTGLVHAHDREVNCDDLHNPAEIVSSSGTSAGTGSRGPTFNATGVPIELRHCPEGMLLLACDAVARRFECQSA